MRDGIKAWTRAHAPTWLLRLRDPSQHGEGATLHALLKAGFPEYLVDVGAHDGRHLSNSWPLLQAGWKGILIEPLPEVFERLEANHRGNDRAICLNLACSDRTTTQRLYIGSDGDRGTMATLCTDDNAWFEAHRTAASVEVSVETLTRILSAHGYPKDFSLLLVDAEGMDYEVLLGLDFDLFQPRVVVTEEYQSNPEKHQKKIQLLRDKGYVLYTLVGVNAFWIRNEFQDPG